MNQKLIFVTGAPGVGKSVVAQALLRRLPDSAWLDGDDVWRMNPFRVDGTSIAIVESNIKFVLRNYLAAGCSHVILSWVLHDQSIIDRILDGLGGLEYELFVFTLVCDEATLKVRLSRNGSGTASSDLPFLRLRQSKALGTIKIDTTDRQPEEIVKEIIGHLARPRRVIG